MSPPSLPKSVQILTITMEYYLRALTWNNPLHSFLPLMSTLDKKKQMILKQHQSQFSFPHTLQKDQGMTMTQIG